MKSGSEYVNLLGVMEINTIREREREREREIERERERERKKEREGLYDYNAIDFVVERKCQFKMQLENFLVKSEAFL